MNSENIIIQHNGYLSYELLNKLMKEFESYADMHSLDNYYFKKIQIVMVEMIENNYQYCNELLSEIQITNNYPEFKIIKAKAGVRMLSSNLVKRTDANILKVNLNRINSFSIPELRKLHTRILDEGMHSVKSTAGIGLIRIAKVTKNKIEYSFKEINNKLLYYTLEIFVNSK